MVDPFRALVGAGTAEVILIRSCTIELPDMSVV